MKLRLPRNVIITTCEISVLIIDLNGSEIVNRNRFASSLMGLVERMMGVSRII